VGSIVLYYTDETNQSTKDTIMSKANYNGWTNYATWRVNLEMFDGSEDTWSADSAREFVEEIIYSTTDEGIARDYALAFIADVNWDEIAAHYQEEESEEEETV
jgi:hypothetical protein